MTKMKTLLHLLVCMYLILVEGSGGSSPFTNADKECRTMLPSKLRSPPREDKNLFRVGVSDTIYHETMHHILVSVENTTDRPVIGVLLQPRLVGCEGPNVNHNVGEFEIIPTNNYFEFLNCRGTPKGTVVTKRWTGKPYKGKIEVNFMIAKTKRKIKFRATIISSHGRIYVNNDSEEIRYLSLNANDRDDSKECPKMEAQPLISNNEAASDHSNKLAISVVLVVSHLFRYILK